eukprot:1532501-Pleurochrysis_carterae.AAC.2
MVSLNSCVTLSSPLVRHPAQFVLYVVSSIHSVSATKPRSTHCVTAPRLGAPQSSQCSVLVSPTRGTSGDDRPQPRH